MKNDDSPQTLWWLRTYDSYELENASWEIQFKIDFAENVGAPNSGRKLQRTGVLIFLVEWSEMNGSIVKTPGIIPNKTWLIAKGDPQLISVSEPFANYALKNEVVTGSIQAPIHELRSRGRVFSSSEL